MTAPTIIISFCGTAGSGKSAAAAHLWEQYDFEVVNWADALKSMLVHHMTERAMPPDAIDAVHVADAKERPIDAIAGVTPRQMMQTLGDWGRALHPDWWVNALADSIGISPKGGAGLYHDRIVIADTRYPNEAAWVLAHGGTLIHLLRAQAAPVRAHSSEQHAADLGAQITLVNNGETLEGLHQLVDGAMAALGITMRSSGGAT